MPTEKHLEEKAQDKKEIRILSDSVPDSDKISSRVYDFNEFYKIGGPLYLSNRESFRRRKSRKEREMDYEA